MGAGSAVAQEKAARPISSRDLMVGWIGVAISGPLRVTCRQSPAIQSIPISQLGKGPTADLSDRRSHEPEPEAVVKEIMKKDNAEVLGGKVAFSPSQSCVSADVPGSSLWVEITTHT
jgi:hypothetical protein